MVSYEGLYNKEYFGDKLNENHLYNKELHFKIIKNGTILPHKDVSGLWLNGFGGVVDENGKFVKRSFIHMGTGDAYTPTEDVLQSSDTVIYLGMFYTVWGHCLTDNMKRLWFLKSDTYKRFFTKCPIVYVPMRGGVIENFSKLLQILEIDVQKMYPIVKPIKFQNVILPDEAFFLDESPITFGKDKCFIDGTLDNFNGNDGSFFTKEYAEMIDIVKNFVFKHYSKMSQKKFYFFHGKNQIGEERIARYFESKGYSILRPETLPLETQLNIFANCESFASVVGSVSHNVIFLKDKSNVILIPRRAAFLNIYQQALNAIYDLDVVYIDSALSLFAKNWTGSFCYIVSENFRKYFGDDVTEKYTEEDFSTFLTYFKYCKQQGLKENPNEMEYLRNILPEFMAQLKQHPDLIRKFGISLN